MAALSDPSVMASIQKMMSGQLSPEDVMNVPLLSLSLSLSLFADYASADFFF
jgi:hypothetical protein